MRIGPYTYTCFRKDDKGHSFAVSKGYRKFAIFSGNTLNAHHLADERGQRENERLLREYIRYIEKHPVTVPDDMMREYMEGYLPYLYAIIRWKSAEDISKRLQKVPCPPERIAVLLNGSIPVSIAPAYRGEEEIAKAIHRAFLDEIPGDSIALLKTGPFCFKKGFPKGKLIQGNTHAMPIHLRRKEYTL